MQPKVSMGVFFEGQWSTRTWENGFPITPTEDIAKLKAAGITKIALQIYEVYTGRLYYHSERFEELGLSKQEDFLKNYINEAKALGLEVWVWSSEKGMPRGSALFQRFQDCLELDQNGNDASSWDHNYPSMCINSPWRDFLKDVYREILAKYPIDVILVSDESGFNDAVRWGGYCPRCRAKFRAEYGQEPPKTPNWEDKDSLWWQFQRAKMDWWLNYLEELAAICKEVKPQVKTAVIINENVLCSVLKGLDWWRVYLLHSIDVVGTDLYYRIFTQDHATHQAAIGSLATSMNKGRKEQFITTPAYRIINPGDIRLGAFNAALSGVNDVFFYNLGYIRDYSDKREAVRLVSDRVAELNEAVAGMRPAKYAGILFSRNEWFGHFAPNAEHLIAEVMGIFQALSLTGVPVEIIDDETLSKADMLRDYKALFIPQPYDVLPEMLSTLREYIANGGRVIVDLLDRDYPITATAVDFWQDLLGITYQGETAPIVALQGKGRFAGLSHEIFQWPVVQHSTFGGYPSVDRRRVIPVGIGAIDVLFENVTATGETYPGIVGRSVGRGYVVTAMEDLGSGISALMAKGWGCESLWLLKAIALARIIRSLGVPDAKDLPFEVSGDSFNIVTKLFENQDRYKLVLINHDLERPAKLNVSCRNQSGGPGKSVTVTVKPADIALVGWGRVDL